MHFPLSAHPTSTAPMPSPCSGSSLCTPSTHCFVDAASNTTASFTVSGATLKCSPIPHPQTPFPSVYSVNHMEFLASVLITVLQRASSIFTCSVVVRYALHGQDRITSNLSVPEYLLAFKGLLMSEMIKFCAS